jgi:hypothetical protein
VQAQVAPSPDDPQPLIEEEIEEKEQLLSEGYSNWNRRDFNSFVRACEKVRSATCSPPSKPPLRAGGTVVPWNPHWQRPLPMFRVFLCCGVLLFLFVFMKHVGANVIVTSVFGLCSMGAAPCQTLRAR